MTDFMKCGYNPVTLFNGGKWSGPAWDKLSADVQAAIAAGTPPFLAGSPWFPPEWTGGVRAYGQYSDGCSPALFAFTVRVHVVNYPVRALDGVAFTGLDGMPSPPLPDHDTPGARFTEFWCEQGNRFELGADDGAMRRSALSPPDRPDLAYRCGIPISGLKKDVKGGQIIESSVGVMTLYGDGALDFMASNVTGDMDVPVFLLGVGDDARPEDGLPKSLFGKIRFDAETHDYCARPPHINPSGPYELGVRLGQKFGTSVIYEMPLNELKFNHYWSPQVANGIPDVHRFIEEVMTPFVRGVQYATQGRAEWFVGEAAGPEDLIAVTLALAEMRVTIKGFTIHVYSWDDGASHKIIDDDWFGGAVKFLTARLSLPSFPLCLITETDKFDELMHLARTQVEASYVTHILGAGGWDGVAKAVR